MTTATTTMTAVFIDIHIKYSMCHTYIYRQIFATNLCIEHVKSYEMNVCIVYAYYFIASVLVTLSINWNFARKLDGYTHTTLTMKCRRRPQSARYFIFILIPFFALDTNLDARTLTHFDFY